MGANTPWPLYDGLVVNPERKLSALEKFCESLWQQASEESELTDVRLFLDDGSKLLAHRCVLSARSSVGTSLVHTWMDAWLV